MSDPFPPTVPPSAKKKNHAWIWFFAFLVAASAGVAGLMIWFNRSIQLTPEQLQAAQQLWKEKGPRDYKLVYSTKIDDAKTANTFVVKVRAGKVQEVLMDGRPLVPEDGHDPRPYRSMERLFNDIERNLQMDEKPDQPKVFVTAIFDDQTGALRRYIRRVMGTPTLKRTEINAKVEELGP